jgi:hypothetical protein
MIGGLARRGPGRGPGRLACLGLALAAALACLAPTCSSPGGGAPVEAEGGQEHALDVYSQSCREQSERLQVDVRAGRYVVPVLRVEAWPGGADGETRDLPEAGLAEALVNGQVRMALVEARAGLGKSRLAQAIVARTCGALPTFQVDLGRWFSEGGGRGAGRGNALLDWLAQGLGLSLQGPEHAAWGERLARQPWLLVLDALDEVDVAAREGVVEALQELRARFPGTLRILVLARPPVFSGDYGLRGVDARLEIPPLDCAQARRVLQARAGERAGAVEVALERLGLTRQRNERGQCSFVHLSTWRDLEVALAVLVPGNGETRWPREGSRAALYDAYVRLALSGGDARAGDRGLALLDRMVADTHPGPGTRSLTFSESACRAACGDPSSAEATCARLFDCDLWEPKLQAGTRRLKNQSLTDLLVARWAAAQLEGPDGCAQVQRLQGLFESNEVAGFLSGLAQGRACLGDILKALCREGAPVDHTVDLLDQGLPAGEPRSGLLAALSADPSLASDACLQAVVRGLVRESAAER